jgi:hypothetical protein
VVRPPLKFKQIVRHDFDADPGYTVFETYGSPGTVSVSGGYYTYTYRSYNNGYIAKWYNVGRALEPRLIIEFKVSPGSGGFVGVGFKLDSSGTRALWLILDTYSNVRKIEYHVSTGTDTVVYSVTGVTAGRWYYERLIVTGRNAAWYESTDGVRWTKVWHGSLPIDPRRNDKIYGIAITTGNAYGYSGQHLIDYVELSYFGGFGYRDLRKVANPDGTWYRDSNGYYYIFVTLGGIDILGSAAGIIRTPNPADPSTWQLYTLLMYKDENNNVYGHHAGWVVVSGTTARVYNSLLGNYDLTKTSGIVVVDVPLSSLLVNDVVVLSYNSASDTFTGGYDPAVVFYNDMWYYTYTDGRNVYLFRCSSMPRFPSECTQVASISYGSATEGGVFNIHNGVPKWYFVYTIGNWYRYSLDGTREAAIAIPAGYEYRKSHPTGFPPNYMFIFSIIDIDGIPFSHGDATVTTVSTSFYNEVVKEKTSITLTVTPL